MLPELVTIVVPVKAIVGVTLLTFMGCLVYVLIGILTTWGRLDNACVAVSLWPFIVGIRASRAIYTQIVQLADKVVKEVNRTA